MINYRYYGRVFHSYIETGSGISRCGDMSDDEDQSSCNNDCTDLTTQDVRLAFKGSSHPHKLSTHCPEFEIVINIVAPPGDYFTWNVCYVSLKTERIETVIIHVDDNDRLTVGDGRQALFIHIVYVM